MEHKWKTGDKAMVTISKGNGDDEGAHYLVYALPDGRKNFWITPGCLSPLPPSITPEAQALLNAAVALETAWVMLGACTSAAQTDFRKAAAYYRASITPPDPVKELIAAAKGYVAGRVSLAGIEDAIAAVEASRELKP
jgi:hypothetical protein